MRKSTNYELNLLDEDDFYNEELFNENTEKIDKLLKDSSSEEGKVTEEERKNWNAKLGTTDVVDNVTSEDTDKPLSANMGKELQKQITENEKTIKSISTSLAEKEIITGTLLAGETFIRISSDRITSNSILSFYTSIYGVSPKNVTVTNGSVAIEVKAQEEDMEVGVSVDG